MGVFIQSFISSPSKYYGHSVCPGHRGDSGKQHDSSCSGKQEKQNYRKRSAKLLKDRFLVLISGHVALDSRSLVSDTKKSIPWFPQTVKMPLKCQHLAFHSDLPLISRRMGLEYLTWVIVLCQEVDMASSMTLGTSRGKWQD